jgi:hypothetical protein
VVDIYALLRRDIEEYVSREFAVAVLDEAQHIKNRSTQNAIAAKRLRTVNRLVLTGTPIENSVTDLWSIMDYLMPDYLGSHEAFRHHYEQPIAAGGPEAEAVACEVAPEAAAVSVAPDETRRRQGYAAQNIERTAWSALTVDQQRVYREMLEASRRQVGDLVSQHGVPAVTHGDSQVLLRFAPDLLPSRVAQPGEVTREFPSAKMELFSSCWMRLAMPATGCVFTSLFHVEHPAPRTRTAEMRYCYQDGATRERMNIVHEFQHEPAIPSS